MTRLLVRLYPASWRARYGDEFESLLEERPLGPFDVADILLAAFDAHLRRVGSAEPGKRFRGVRMTLRNGGIAAIVGGGLWLISFVGVSTIRPDDGQPWLTLLVVAVCALVLAIVGLSAEQGRRQSGVIWAAVGLPVVGAAASVVGLAGMVMVGDAPFILGASPWMIWALGTIALITGSGLFALASLRVRSVSRVGATLLVIGAAAVLPLLLGVSSPDGPGALGTLIFIVGLFGFAAGWIWVGISAIRTDRAGLAAYPDAVP